MYFTKGKAIRRAELSVDSWIYQIPSPWSLVFPCGTGGRFVSWFRKCGEMEELPLSLASYQLIASHCRSLK